MRRSILCASGAFFLSACAPTTISPMLVRFHPGDPMRDSVAIGVRSGPRISAAVSNQTLFAGSTYSFKGDRNSFSLPQLGFAFDISGTRALDSKLSIHAGVQGEFYDPVPVPAYGLYTGASYHQKLGLFSIAPAACLRGASDFGLPAPGGPGTLAGLELSMTLGYAPDDRVTVGIVPFVGFHKLWSNPVSTHALYAGGIVAVVIALPLSKVEMSGGFGRVFMPGLDSWNVPIMGLRGVR